MVHLTRIYTRTGDDGTTSLGDMSRTGKNDPRLVAYADVDEANSCLGLTLATTDIPDDVRGLLLSIQNDLFDVGADLSCPITETAASTPLRITEEYITRIEQACDQYNQTLTPLRSFVLPGGTPAAATLHVARTVVRRAERSAWRALDAYRGGVNPLTATYLNRLSDLLFILARAANNNEDVLWHPGGTPPTA